MGKMIRAITADGGFRAVVIRADDMVQGVLDAQEPASGHEMLGELLVSSVLVRETMMPDYRVQLTLRAPTGSLFADSHPQGLTRGLVSGQVPQLGEDTGFHVARVLPGGKLQQGLIQSDSRGVSASLNAYMIQSEQVTSMVGVACDYRDGKVRAASGFLVQLLPDAPPDSTALVLEGVETLPDDWVSHDPDLLMASVIGMAGYRILEERDVFFGCGCSQDRVVAALGTMGRDELSQVIESGEVLDVDCEYCSTTYTVTPQMLSSLL